MGFQCKCNDCIFIKSVLIRRIIRTGVFTEDFKSVKEVFFVKIQHSIYTLYQSRSTVLRVSIHGRMRPWTPCVQFAIKMPKEQRNAKYNSKDEMNRFRDEMLFYQIFTDRLKKDKILPTYIMLNRDSKMLQPLFIIMEDLISRGFKQFDCKLDEKGLRTCLKGLAWFHVNVIRLLRKERNTIGGYLWNAVFHDTNEKRIIEENIAR